MSETATAAKTSRFGMVRTGRLVLGLVTVLGYFTLVVPSLVVIPVSFGGRGELSFPPSRVSLDLYFDFFADGAWWGAAMQSFKVAVLSTGLTVALSLPAAYALGRGTFPGRQVLTVVFLSPILVPLIVLGLGLYLHFAGLDIAGTTASLVIAHTVLASPFAVLSIASGLRQIDPALETAATIMGAGRSRILLRVVIPQIRASIAIAALFAFLISFDDVIIAYFVSGATTMTLPVKMFSAIRWEISPVIAAVSTLLTGLSLIVCVAMMVLQNRETTD